MQAHSQHSGACCHLVRLQSGWTCSQRAALGAPSKVGVDVQAHKSSCRCTGWTHNYFCIRPMTLQDRS